MYQHNLVDILQQNKNVILHYLSIKYEENDLDTLEIRKTVGTFGLFGEILSILRKMCFSNLSYFGPFIPHEFLTGFLVL